MKAFGRSNAFANVTSIVGDFGSGTDILVISPDVTIPILYVNVVHEGISPEDAERLLIKPLETELRGIDGVKEMRSTAHLGGANVLLEFEAGFDADQALLDVREKVDLAKPELPSEAEELL